MFGFGAAVGLFGTVKIVNRLFDPASRDESEFFRILFLIVGTIVAMPAAGIVAVLLTFAAHHFG